MDRVKKEAVMAKGQQRSNREAKKPKMKPAVAAPASAAAPKGVLADPVVAKKKG